MRRESWVMISAALGLIVGVGTGGTGDEPRTVPPPPAQPSNRAGDTTSQRFDDAVQDLRRGARNVGETVQEEFKKVRSSVHDMGIQSRVYSRLHWDKDLSTSHIDLEFKGGTITLRGSVKSVMAKAKAIELARDTLGVDRVEDHLAIEPAVPVTEPAPAVKGKT